MSNFIEITSVYGDLTAIDLSRVVAFQDIEKGGTPVTRVWLDCGKTLDLDIAYTQLHAQMKSFSKKKRKR
jgi:hypothetical protein